MARIRAMYATTLAVHAPKEGVCVTMRSGRAKIGVRCVAELALDGGSFRYLACGAAAVAWFAAQVAELGLNGEAQSTCIRKESRADEGSTKKSIRPLPNHPYHGSRAMHATDPSPAQPPAQAHESAAVRTAPLALWRVAEVFLQVLHALFGGPDDVAARHTLTGKAHGVLASWLRCGEAMLRRLIVIEAAAYPRPNTRPLLRPPRKRTPKLMHFAPDTPEQWRVRFRCFASLRQAQHDAEGGAAGPVSGSLTPDLIRRKRPKRNSRDLSAEARRAKAEERWCLENRPPVKFRSAWPLAERYEALLRVFNDPAPYAHRLSRRLHATPHRLGEPLRAPPEAAHRVDRFEALGDAAREAWRPHFSSA